MGFPAEGPIWVSHGTRRGPRLSDGAPSLNNAKILAHDPWVRACVPGYPMGPQKGAQGLAWAQKLKQYIYIYIHMFFVCFFWSP